MCHTDFVSVNREYFGGIFFTHNHRLHWFARGKEGVRENPSEK